MRFLWLGLGIESAVVRADADEYEAKILIFNGFVN